jgi:DNA-directed RNA polymerase specialized sigma24 family protein
MSELDLEAALRGLLRLAVAEREERLERDAEPRRTEVLLDEAGLTYAQIAEVTGKKPDAVRMAIKRASEPTRKAKNA